MSDGRLNNGTRQAGVTPPCFLIHTTMEVIADEKLHPPDEVAGWTRTTSSKASEYPGVSYENPQADREFVIVGPVSLTQTDRVIFKYNPHKRPEDRRKVTGFETYKASLEYSVEWMRENPVDETNMTGEDVGLQQFAGGTDGDEEDSTQEIEEVDTEPTTTNKQEHPSLLLEEYNKDGEKLPPSPIAEGYEYAETLPPQEEWPEGWLNKTEDFEYYEEGMDNRKRHRKRVICDCGLSMDVTGTAFSVLCHGCSSYLIDLNPSDEPSTDTKSNTGGGLDVDAEQIGFKDEEPDQDDTTDESETEDEASGLQAFVDNNS